MRVCKKKSGHGQIRVWPWPLETSLGTFLYLAVISLHAPFAETDSNTKDLRLPAKFGGVWGSK
jgi:hypothetical protein